MRDTDEPIRSRARALLKLPSATADIDTNDMDPGDFGRGERIFVAHCGQCHKSDETGNANFGPDLATIRHWPRQALLDKIKNPQRSVASGYEQWRITLTNGNSLDGVIAAETPTTITMLTLTNTHTLRRDDMAKLTALPGSAMPAGLDAAMSREDLIDLLSFLLRENAPR